MVGLLASVRGQRGLQSLPAVGMGLSLAEACRCFAFFGLNHKGVGNLPLRPLRQLAQAIAPSCMHQNLGWVHGPQNLAYSRLALMSCEYRYAVHFAPFLSLEAVVAML